MTEDNAQNRKKDREAEAGSGVRPGSGVRLGSGVGEGTGAQKVPMEMAVCTGNRVHGQEKGQNPLLARIIAKWLRNCPDKHSWVFRQEKQPLLLPGQLIS
jgi:hypothetical protein